MSIILLATGVAMLCYLVREFKKDYQRSVDYCIEQCNEQFGGDWYYDDKRSLFCDSMTDRTCRMTIS